MAPAGSYTCLECTKAPSTCWAHPAQQPRAHTASGVERRAFSRPGGLRNRGSRGSGKGLKASSLKHGEAGLAREQFLAGTFNKIVAYQSPVFFELHVGAHQALRDSSTLVVIGYRFRDKAINTRIIDWLADPNRRMVLVHRKPVAVLNGRRPAIRDAICHASEHGRVATVEKCAEAVTWEEISAELPRAVFRSVSALSHGTASFCDSICTIHGVEFKQ
jgi:hypothetical protein